MIFIFFIALIPIFTVAYRQCKYKITDVEPLKK